METKDKKISQLPIAVALDGKEMIPFAKSGGNGSVLVELLKSFIIDGLATVQSVTELANTIALTYAKQADIPDIRNLGTKEQYQQVIDAMTQTQALVKTLQKTIDSLPAIPLSDGKCYAMCNGQWVEIAGAAEDVLVAAEDSEEDISE